MLRSRAFHTAAVALLALLAGCHAAPAVISQHSHAQEKDVLVVFVELAEPIGAAEYRRLAERKLAELGSPPQNPYGEIPLYEVQYRFRRGKGALATVYFRHDSLDDEFAHLRTYVYPPRGTNK